MIVSFLEKNAILAISVDPLALRCNDSLVSMLNPEIAGQLADDLPTEVFLTIVATFRTDAFRLVGEMASAAQAGDLNARQRAAHSLAGAAAAVGAQQLEALARQAMHPHGTLPSADHLNQMHAQAVAATDALAALAGRAG